MPTTEIGRPGRHEIDLDHARPRRRDPVARASVFFALFAFGCAFVPAARTYGVAACALAIALGLAARRRARRARPQGAEMAWAGLILAVLSGIGLVASQSAFGSVAHQGTAPPVTGTDGKPAGAVPGVVGTDIDVKFGRPIIELEEFGQRKVTVPVTITNRSDRRASFDLDFEARDAKGKVITTDNAFVPGLAGEQVAQVRVFNIVNDKLLDQLLKATFAVTSAVAY
jgi:hypothetical protein